MRKDEKERKKNLVPNFVYTRLGQENSQKNSKKIQKIKKLNSSMISIQKGLREAKKERNNFIREFRSYPRRVSVSKKNS